MVGRPKPPCGTLCATTKRWCFARRESAASPRLDRGSIRAHSQPVAQTLRDSLIQLDDYRWQIPREGGMRVPGVLFADRELVDQMMSDRTPEQVKNAAHLPGIVDASIAMPDAHWGYGLPVGGVVATDEREGVVSPGAVG